MPLNATVMTYTRLNFDWALRNFRLLLKLGLLVGWGQGQVAPPLPLSAALPVDGDVVVRKLSIDTNQTTHV